LYEEKHQTSEYHEGRNDGDDQTNRFQLSKFVMNTQPKMVVSDIVRLIYAQRAKMPFEFSFGPLDGSSSSFASVATSLHFDRHLFVRSILLDNNNNKTFVETMKRGIRRASV
jgi:hypothetical protein